MAAGRNIVLSHLPFSSQSHFLTVILVHGKDLDDHVGLLADRDPGEVDDELVGEAVADVDLVHAVALTGHLRHRDVDAVVAVADGALASLSSSAATVGGPDVVGCDPIDAETLVVARSHDAHAHLVEVGTGQSALRDPEMVLGGIGPWDARLCKKDL